MEVSKVGKRSSSPSKSASSAAGKAVGQSFGKLGMAATKTAVDLPLAMAEGMHNIPALYGEKVRDLGEVRGWKSGGVVGVKVSLPPWSLNSLLGQLLTSFDTEPWPRNV